MDDKFGLWQMVDKFKEKLIFIFTVEPFIVPVQYIDGPPLYYPSELQ